MLFKLCNVLASYNRRWQEHTNLTRTESVNFARRLKTQPVPFTNGVKELNKILKKCRLDDPSFKYVPAAQTDIRLTIKRELKRLAEPKDNVRWLNEKVAK